MTAPSMGVQKLWLKIAHTGGASAATMLSSALGLMITAHVLGPEGRGVYAATVAWVSLVSTLGTLSLGQVVVHHVAGKPHAEWLSDVMGSVASVTLASTVVGWLVLAGLQFATRGRIFGDVPGGTLSLALVALPFLLWSDAIRYVLTAMGDVIVSNWAQIAGAVTAVACMLALILGLGLGLPGAVGAFVVGAAVPALLTLAHVRRHAGGLRVSPTLIRQLLRGSARLHVNSVGTYLYTQASVLVLNYYRPASETAYYQLAVQLIGMALIVSNSVSIVAFELVAKLGPDGAWPAHRRLLGQAVAMVSVAAVFAYVLAPFGIRLVAGERFLPAVRLFRILLPALIGATFASVMASQWIGRGLFVQAALLTLATGLISLACDLLFIPTHGAYGALVSTLVTYGISVVGNGIMIVWIQSRPRSLASVVARPIP